MEFALISWQTAAICAAYFTAGVTDAVCGGGGIVTVPTLMAVGLPVHYIAGTNVVAAAIGNIASFCKYLKSGKIYYKIGITAAVAALIGGVLGAELNMFVPERCLQIVMIVIMPLMALLVLFNRRFGEVDRSEEISDIKLFVLSAVIGLLVGLYQGFYGPGAGILFVMGFTLFIKIDLVKASGTAKIAAICAAASAAVTYAVSGLIIWEIAIISTACHFIGNYLGASIAIKNGAKVIRPFILIAAGLLFIKLILDL